MGVFEKLFRGNKRVSRETIESRGVYMPEPEIPVDEKFTIHFIKNGGKLHTMAPF